MRKPGVKIIAAAVTAAAFAASGTAQAAAPCAPVPTSYDSGGAPLAGFPNDPLFPRQWGLAQVKAPQAWARGAQGSGATIAIVDSGVDLNHPDLSGKLVPGRDFASGASCASGGQDRNGHGTRVAGIAAATTNNGIGVAGTAPLAQIMPVRVLDEAGNGSSVDVSAGIKWAADNGAQVVNLSLGDTTQVPLDVSGIGAAVDYAFAKGAVVVAAAGNESFPFCEYPSMSKNAVCVAANDSTGFPSLYSNFPARLDGGVAVRAPGGNASGCGDGDIWSTYWPGASGAEAESCGPRGYEPLAGTSMATPFVSGIAAMLRGAGLTNVQVMDCLRNTSSNGGIYDPIRGYGNVNAEAAVAGCTQIAAGGGKTPGGETTSGTGQPGAQAPAVSPQQPGQGERSADATAPRVRVTVPLDKKAHAARAGYVTVRVRLSEAAKVALEIVDGRETAVAGRNAVVVAEGVVKLNAGTHAVKVRLTKTGKRVLRVRRVVTVTLLALARDASGNDGTAIAEGKIRR